ncbi:MAG TPA: hypothetical protein PLQ41_01165 [bacterium]|nr:hypothetical protein [bacterium]HPP29437.1 hypothetical protein [bacterium]
MKYVKTIVVAGMLLFLAGSSSAMSRRVSQQKTNEEGKESVGVLEEILMPSDLTEEEKADWKKGIPPGWSKGKKTGWRGGNMPPGLAKKQGQGKKVGKAETPSTDEDKEKPEGWKERMEKIRERIRKHKGEKSAEAETMIYSAEAAAESGVPPETLEEVTEKFLQKKLTAEEYEKTTRAMAYGVEKNINFEQLGTFINSNIEQGVRGNELAIKVYKEIASRSKK